MPQRILLIGANGQLGWELHRSLRPLGEVVATRRRPAGRNASPSVTLDLSRFDDIRGVVRTVRPEIIVNAAAYTDVDQAETDTQAAMLINGEAPRVLAEEAARASAMLVHYSTDYVFNGQGDRPWREDDQPAPLNAYGRSKLAGEEAIRASSAVHLILRTSWVHGVRGKNFVRTLLRLGSERTELSVVSDQIGSPTSARVISDTTAHILTLGGDAPLDFFSQHGRTYHLACQGTTSRYEFALEIFRMAAGYGCALATQTVRPVPSSEFPTPARRPKNSRLDCTCLCRAFGTTLPDWRVALRHSVRHSSARSAIENAIDQRIGHT